MARRVTLAGSMLRQMFRVNTNHMATSTSGSIPPATTTSSSSTSNSEEICNPPVDINYITNRLDNVFNIVLSDIQSSPNPKNLAMLSDPYKYKDQVLQELLRNVEFNRDYNIQDMIEQEFTLEISDQEFAKFKSLKDIAVYVKQRIEIRQQIPLQTQFANLHLSY